jgi:hypothetical protein
MKLSNTIYVLILTISLVGCGGGGKKASQNESADGVWIGYSNRSEIVSIFYGGKYITLNYIDKKFYSGSYTITGDSISSQDSKSYLWDGLNTGMGSMDGTVYSKSTIQSTYTGEGEANTIGLEINSDLVVYETSIAEKKLKMNDLKGSWTTRDASNKLRYAFSLDGEKFYAEESEGCLIEGEVTIPNGNLNIFGLSLQVSGTVCTYNGNYTGLGFLTTKLLTNDDESQEEVDLLTFAYSNESYGFVFEAEKFGL